MLLENANPIYAKVYTKSYPSSAEYSLRNETSYTFHGVALESSGFKRRWERNFPYLFRTTLRPTQPPVQHVPGLFPVRKAVGALR
jgi:hypothetical protein